MDETKIESGAFGSAHPHVAVGVGVLVGVAVCADASQATDSRAKTSRRTRLILPLASPLCALGAVDSFLLALKR